MGELFLTNSKQASIPIDKKNRILSNQIDLYNPYNP
jgi:hypothetical protein